jgi:RNA polymerase sigma-70 factor, ECF subfamily
MEPFLQAGTGQITQALLDVKAGDEAAAGRLWDLLYGELRQMAHRELLGERHGHTLSTTALVHEAYLRLVDHSRITLNGRTHFLALSCRAMRAILVDYARRRNAQKRGGGKAVAPLDEALAMAEARGEELLALDEALTRLAALDERMGKVVECRYFGGLTTEETAEVMGVSHSTVERQWTRARTYLYQALQAGERTA